MAPTMDSQYKDLLNPQKDPEKAFAVNISELLISFINDLQGRATPNFNSAALLIQGSASVYAKKVEYLHNLATQLHNLLLKQKKSDKEPQAEKEKKESAPKERAKKKDKSSDPFLSTEIKVGRNLSCLNKRNSSKAASKKAITKDRNKIPPIHLLINDNDEKGDVFYDTMGDIVGNKGDFAINKCRLTSSGWLLLPSVSSSLIPSPNERPHDYESCTSPETANESEPIHSSPDEGFGSCPPSSDIQQSTPATEASCPSSSDIQQSTPATEADSQETNMNSASVPMSVDEGIGDTPDIDDSPGDENIPTDDVDDDLEDNQTSDPEHARRPNRILMEVQDNARDEHSADIENKELLKKRAIEKNITHKLPRKLRNPPPDGTHIETLTVYCARTFFEIENKDIQENLLEFSTPSFKQNVTFMKRILEKIEALRASHKNNKDPDEDDDEGEVDVEGTEVSREANDEDNEILGNSHFEENDINVEHDPEPLNDSANRALPEVVNSDDVPASDMPSPDITHIAHEENENYIKEVQQFVQNSDITERVHEWEKNVKPFLDITEQRGSFDINLYGSTILNSFEDSTRKQTKTFRELCRNMEKWEIHRYFMAVLPLANMYNVELDKEKKPDGTEEIFITLLSRKMHHKELENFGHSEGEHS